MGKSYIAETLRQHLRLDLSERSAHTSLDLKCTADGPVTADQLGDLLGVSVSQESFEPIALCGNPSCGNPLHYVFIHEAERYEVDLASKRAHIRHCLLNTQLRHAGIARLKKFGNCSGKLVQDVQRELKQHATTRPQHRQIHARPGN